MQFTLETTFKTSAEKIYKTWLDSNGHSLMTGGPAQISDQLGTPFTAWDGYISGSNLELEPNKRIVQTWRTTEFTPEEEDSKIEILLEEKGGQTKLTLIHTNLPKHGDQYYKGWQNHYFTPMQAYFQNE